MSRVWVVNASPLILLGKIGRISFLSGLSDELIVPEPVVREIRDKSQGEPVVSELASFRNVRIEAEIALSPEVAVWNLGPGESQGSEYR